MTPSIAPFFIPSSFIETSNHSSSFNKEKAPQDNDGEFSPDFLRIDQSLHLLHHYSYCDKDGIESTPSKTASTSPFFHIKPTISPNQFYLFQSLENFISLPRQLVYQEFNTKSLSNILKISFQLNALLGFFTRSLNENITGPDQKISISQLSLERIELIGKSALHQLGIETFYEMGLKFFDKLEEKEPGMLKKWFEKAQIKKQFEIGSDIDIRVFLKHSINHDHLDFRLDKLIDYLSHSFDKNFSLFTPLIQSELSKKEPIRYQSGMSVNQLKRACLREFGAVSRKDVIFTSENQYGLVTLSSSTDSSSSIPIDILLVNKLQNKNLFSRNSITVDFLPLWQGKDASLSVYCDPYTPLQFLMDLINGTFYVFDPDKNLTADHLFRFLSDTSCYGTRILQENLEQRMLQKLFDDEKNYLAKVERKFTQIEKTSRFYLFARLQEYIHKHLQHKPFSAFLFTFNTCQLLLKYTNQHHSLTDKDYEFIWSELDKSGLFKWDETTHLFFNHLKKVLFEEKIPFSKAAAFLQCLSFLFAPSRLTRHNGRQPTFSIELPEEGGIHFLLPYQPLENMEILKTVTFSPTLLSLYSTFPSKDIQSVYPSPLAKHADALRTSQKRFIEEALTWMEQHEPFAVYLGYQFYLATPKLSEPNQEMWELLLSHLPKLFGSFYVVEVLNGLEALAKQTSNPFILGVTGSLKACLPQERLEIWQTCLIQSKLTSPKLIYIVYQFYQKNYSDPSKWLKLFHQLRQVDISKASQTLTYLYKQNTLAIREKIQLFNLLYPTNSSFIPDSSLLGLIDDLLNSDIDFLSQITQTEHATFSQHLVHVLEGLSNKKYIKQRNEILLKASQKKYLIPQLKLSQFWLHYLTSLQEKPDHFHEAFTIAQAGGYLAAKELSERQLLEKPSSAIEEALHWMQSSCPSMIYLGFQLYLAISQRPQPQVSESIFIFNQLPYLFETPYLEGVLAGLIAWYKHYHCEPFLQVLLKAKKCDSKQLKEMWLSFLLQTRNACLLDCVNHYKEHFLSDYSNKLLDLRLFNYLHCIDMRKAAELLYTLFQKGTLTSIEKVRGFIILFQPKYMFPLEEAQAESFITEMLDGEIDFKSILKEKIGELSAPLLHAIQFCPQRSLEFLKSASVKGYLTPNLAAIDYWLQCLEKLKGEKQEKFFDTFQLAYEQQFLTLPPQSSLIDPQTLELEKRIKQIKIQFLDIKEAISHPLSTQILQELMKEKLDPSLIPHLVKTLKGLIENSLQLNQIDNLIISYLELFIKLTEIKSADALFIVASWLRKVIDPSVKIALTESAIAFTDSLLAKKEIALNFQQTNKSTYDWLAYPMAYLKVSHHYVNKDRLNCIWTLFSYLDKSKRLIFNESEMIHLLINCLQIALNHKCEIPPFIIQTCQSSYLSLLNCLKKDSQAEGISELFICFKRLNLQLDKVEPYRLWAAECLWKEKKSPETIRLFFFPSSFNGHSQLLSSSFSFLHDWMQILFTQQERYIEGIEWLKMCSHQKLSIPERSQLKELVLNKIPLILEIQQFEAAIDLLLTCSYFIKYPVIRSSWLSLLHVLDDLKQHLLIEKILLNKSVHELFKDPSPLIDYAKKEFEFCLENGGIENLKKCLTWIKTYLPDDPLPWINLWKTLASQNQEELLPVKQEAWENFCLIKLSLESQPALTEARCWADIFQVLEHLGHPHLIHYFSPPDFLKPIQETGEIRTVILKGKQSLLKGMIKQLKPDDPNLDLVNLIFDQKASFISCFKEDLPSEFDVELSFACFEQLKTSKSSAYLEIVLQVLTLHLKTNTHLEIDVKLFSYLFLFFRNFNQGFNPLIHTVESTEEKIETRFLSLLLSFLNKISDSPSFYPSLFKSIQALSVHSTQARIELMFRLANKCSYSLNLDLPKTYEKELKSTFEILINCIPKNKHLTTFLEISCYLKRNFEILNISSQRRDSISRDFLSHYFVIIEKTYQEIASNSELSKKSTLFSYTHAINFYRQFAPFVFSSPAVLQRFIHTIVSYTVHNTQEEKLILFNEILFKNQVESILLVPFDVPETEENLKSLKNYSSWITQAWQQQCSNGFLWRIAFSMSLEKLIRNKEKPSLIYSYLQEFIYLETAPNQTNPYPKQFYLELINLAKEQGYFKDHEDMLIKLHMSLGFFKQPFSFHRKSPFIEVWKRLLEAKNPQAHLRALDLFSLTIPSLFDLKDKQDQDCLFDCLQFFNQFAAVEFLPKEEQETLFSKLFNLFLIKNRQLFQDVHKNKFIKDLLDRLFKILKNKVIYLNTQPGNIKLTRHYFSLLIILISKRVLFKEFSTNIDHYFQYVKDIFPLCIELIKNLKKENEGNDIEVIDDSHPVIIVDLIHVQLVTLSEKQKKQQKKLLVEWFELLLNSFDVAKNDYPQQSYLRESLFKALLSDVFSPTSKECTTIFYQVLKKMENPEKKENGFLLKALELRFQRHVLDMFSYFGEIEKFIQDLRKNLLPSFIEENNLYEIIIDLILQKKSGSEKELNEQSRVFCLSLKELYEVLFEKIGINFHKRIQLLNVIEIGLSHQIFNQRFDKAKSLFDLMKMEILKEPSCDFEPLINLLELHFQMDVELLTIDTLHQHCQCLKQMFPNLIELMNHLESFLPSVCFMQFLITMSTACSMLKLSDPQQHVALLFVSWLKCLSESFKSEASSSFFSTHLSVHLSEIFNEAYKYKLFNSNHDLLMVAKEIVKQNKIDNIKLSKK